jgi:hypothetical protein
MWSSETCIILWTKTLRTFGRGMTLRYSRGEGWGWMRLASRTAYHMDYMWSSETCMILLRKTTRTFGRGMTLRYSKGDGFWWMRLASHTGRSYRLATVFSLITFSKQKPVSKKNQVKLHITWITCGPPKHAWFYEGKLLNFLGGGMTLRYNRGEGGWD